MKSVPYMAIGCNLDEPDLLRKVLESEMEVSKCSFLLVAEVSVTYMDTEKANALISWAKWLGDGQSTLYN